jgi:4-hydroxy-tetrahydrodipicolinate reductase
MPVASLRAGHIPGSHSVGFDSPADTVRLEHVARNREGLAEGAMFAAKWVIGKTGFHAFPDIIDKLVTESLHEKK